MVHVGRVLQRVYLPAMIHGLVDDVGVYNRPASMKIAFSNQDRLLLQRIKFS